MEYRNWQRGNSQYVCTRLRLVEHLRNRGYLPIKTIPDKNNPKYNVWIYENNEALEEAIEEFFIIQENRVK